jgi:hypothetical protein
MTMVFQDEGMRATLGMDTEGHCLRHPNILICSRTTTTKEFLTICRICDSEFKAGGVMRQRKSMVYAIRQIQELHATNDRKQNWGGVMEDEVDEEKEDNDSQGSAPKVPTSPPMKKAAGMEYKQQAVLRGAQVQEWVIQEKDNEIERLVAEVERLKKENEGFQANTNALQTTVDQQTEQIATLQAKTEKQQRTINQELRMIKSIAMKRADSRRSSLKSSTVSSPNMQAGRKSYDNEVSFSSLASQEAPPRLPDRKPSGKGAKKVISEMAAPTSISDGSDETPSAAVKESPPKLPVRQMSDQLQITSMMGLKSPSSSANDHDMERQVSFNNQENNTPPSLPQRQASHDTKLSNLSDITLSLRTDITSSTDHFRGSGVTMDTETGEFVYNATSSTDHFRGSGVTMDTETGEFVYNATSDDDEEEASLKFDSYSPASPGVGSKPSIVDEEEISKPAPIPSMKERPASASQEIAFFPTESEIINEKQPSSPPPPPPIETPQSVARSTAEVPMHEKSLSQEIEFDASATFFDIHPRDITSRRSSLSDMKFDASQQLLLEASQAISTGNMPTPHSVKLRKSLLKNIKEIKASRSPSSRKEIEFTSPIPNSRKEIEFASPILSNKKEIEFEAPQIEFEAPPNPTKTTLELHLEGDKADYIQKKTQEEILDEKVFGNAAVPNDEDEELDFFDAMATDLPVGNHGFLDCNRSVNLSPVSALTTTSYMYDTGLQDDDDEEEVGPRKALHQAGQTKRLPLEENFDSGEDDDSDEDVNPEDAEVENDEQEGVPEPPPEVTKLSPHERRDGHPQHAERQNNGEASQQQNSAQSNETNVMSPKVQRHPSSPKPRDSKPPKQTFRVDGQTVHDKYGDGGLYTGKVSVDDRLPHGFGKMKYDNERQYEGDWRDGRW